MNNSSFTNQLLSPFTSPVSPISVLASPMMSPNTSRNGKVRELIQDVLQKNRPRKFQEDNLGFVSFMGHIILGAFFGVLLGAILDNVTSKLQGSRTNRAWSLLFVIVQVAFIAFALQLGIRYRSSQFDSWLLETLTGQTFGILFLATQPTLGNNTTTFLKF